LREERRLRVFENRVLRRTFGPKRDEDTEKWRKLHKRGNSLYVLLTKYYWGDQIKKNEIGGTCSTYWGREVHTGFWRENER
jgi:hypothetical protein